MHAVPSHDEAHLAVPRGGSVLGNIPEHLGYERCCKLEFKARSPLAEHLPRRAPAFFDCLNHRNMTGHLDVVFAVFEPEYLHQSYSTMSFWNLGCYRLRLMLVAREVILSMLDLEMGCPEPVDVAYAAEAVSYLTRWAEVGTTRKKRLDTDGVIKPSTKATAIASFSGRCTAVMMYTVKLFGFGRANGLPKSLSLRRRHR